MYDALVQPPVGFQHESVRGNVIVHGTYAAGSVMGLDFGMTYATTADVGSADSIWANVVEPDTTSINSGPLVVLENSGTSGKRVGSTMVGRVNALVLPSSLTITPGTRLFGVDGEVYLTDDPGAGDRCVARALESYTGASAGLVLVEFDGRHGLFTHIVRP